MSPRDPLPSAQPRALGFLTAAGASLLGGMAERPKATVLKTVEAVSPSPWVQIPLPPLKDRGAGGSRWTLVG